MKRFLKFVPTTVIAGLLLLIVWYGMTAHPKSVQDFPAWMQVGIVLSYAVFIIIALVVLAVVLMTTKPKPDTKNKEPTVTKSATQPQAASATIDRTGTLTLEEMFKLADRAKWDIMDLGRPRYTAYIEGVSLEISRYHEGPYTFSAQYNFQDVGIFKETDNGPIRSLYEKLEEQRRLAVEVRDAERKKTQDAEDQRRAERRRQAQEDAAGLVRRHILASEKGKPPTER